MLARASLYITTSTHSQWNDNWYLYTWQIKNNSNISRSSKKSKYVKTDVGRASLNILSDINITLTFMQAFVFQYIVVGLHKLQLRRLCKIIRLCLDAEIWFREWNKAMFVRPSSPHVFNRPEHYFALVALIFNSIKWWSNQLSLISNLYFNNRARTLFSDIRVYSGALSCL